MTDPEAAPAAAPGELARLLDARLQHQGVGLVALQVDGERIDLAARGRRRAGADAPLRDDALLEIGSITKTFTALLLADAVQRGALKLGDAVEEALAPRRLRDGAGEPIRWIDLATHRSGLPRLPGNLAPQDPADPYADYAEAQLETFLAEFEPPVARGTRWEYSNLGYGLLGHALARTAKTPYAELLAQRVLEPLGLRDAHLVVPAAQRARRAAGHDAQGRPVPPWHFGVLAPAGALVMPAATLARYAQAALGVFDHPLREAFALAMREHASGPSPMNPIGLAWLRAPLNGRSALNHDGGTFGFAASLWLDPQRRRAAAVIANAFVEVQDLALHLLDSQLRTVRDA